MIQEQTWNKCPVSLRVRLLHTLSEVFGYFDHKGKKPRNKTERQWKGKRKETSNTVHQRNKHKTIRILSPSRMLTSCSRKMASTIIRNSRQRRVTGERAVCKHRKVAHHKGTLLPNGEGTQWSSHAALVLKRALRRVISPKGKNFPLILGPSPYLTWHEGSSEASGLVCGKREKWEFAYEY